MTALFRRLSATRQLAAIVALATVCSPAFGGCRCDDEVETGALPQAESATATASAMPLTNGTVATAGCCCENAAPLELTLDSRVPDLPHGCSAISPGGSVPPVDARATEGPASTARWLVEASPPHAPPLSFALPLRI